MLKILSIIVIAFGWFFTASYSVKQDETMFSIDKALKLLIGSAVFFIAILLMMLIIVDNPVLLIPPLGILLASLIASASLMKSIDSNQKLKHYEINLQKKAKLIFIKHILHDITKYLDVISPKQASWSMIIHDEKYINDLKLIIEEMIDTWNHLYSHEYIILLSTTKIYATYQSTDQNIYNIEQEINKANASQQRIMPNYTSIQASLTQNINDLNTYLEDEIKKI